MFPICHHVLSPFPLKRLLSARPAPQPPSLAPVQLPDDPSPALCPITSCSEGIKAPKTLGSSSRPRPAGRSPHSPDMALLSPHPLLPPGTVLALWGQWPLGWGAQAPAPSSQASSPWCPFPGASRGPRAAVPTLQQNLPRVAPLQGAFPDPGAGSRVPLTICSLISSQPVSTGDAASTGLVPTFRVKP